MAVFGLRVQLELYTQGSGETIAGMFSTICSSRESSVLSKVQHCWAKHSSHFKHP